MVVYSQFTESDTDLEKEIAAAKAEGDFEKAERLLHLRIQNLIGFIDVLSK